MSDSTAVQLTVNGEPAEMPEGATLDQLIQQHLGLEQPVPPTMPVAAEVNTQIVTRADWSGCRLATGDTIEIIGAQGGG